MSVENGLNPRLRRFKQDQDEIWQECSWNKYMYASTVGVGSPIRCYSLKMAPVALFHKKSAATLWVKMKRPPAMLGAYAAAFRQFLAYSSLHLYLFCTSFLLSLD